MYGPLWTCLNQKQTTNMAKTNVIQQQDQEVVFKMKVNYADVEKEYQKVLETPQSNLIRMSTLKILTALLCSEYVYVPESQLERYLPYCRKIALDK